MGWTYTKRPARSARDALRLMIGDTNASDPLLSDEEADYYLGNNGKNVVLAAAEACEALAARFARNAIFSAADMEQSLASKAESYLKLARQLRGRAGMRRAIIRSSGQGAIVEPWQGGLYFTEEYVMIQGILEDLPAAFRLGLAGLGTMGVYLFGG